MARSKLRGLGLLLLGGAILCWAEPLHAQYQSQPGFSLAPAVEIEVTDAAAPVPAANGEPAAAGAESEEAKQKAEEDKKKKERIQKINKLTFDRRPSSILNAWAEPATKPAKDEEPEDASADKESEQKPDPFADQLKAFQRHVTLGHWPMVQGYLKGLPEDEGEALYKKLLSSLQSVPKGTPANRAVAGGVVVQAAPRSRQPETNSFGFEDVIALAAAAPMDLDKSLISSLGQILQKALTGGNVIDELVKRLEAEAGREEPAFTRRQSAQLMFAAGRPIEAGEFLPSVEDATEGEDFEALNLLSRHLTALYGREKKTQHLESAWHVTQAVLGSASKDEERVVALRRAVELAPKIRETLGKTWLEESFTGKPERGMEILASIGANSAQGLQNQSANPSMRLTSLKLQTTAVEALLTSAPERAEEWRDTLNLLAANWLREAMLSYQMDTSTQRGPMLQRDSFGNYFYMSNGMVSRPRTSNRVRPIPTGELIEIKPSEHWLSLVTASLKPKFDMTFAQLFLKVNEEDAAFPYIEQLATVYPEMAQELVSEFLRVWTQNHDPNSSRNRTNHYMFMYGFERRAESIPLTRSKQERNLKELAGLVKRLRALPLEELDEQLLARAFTTCHSSAEVYRLDAIERVFGSLDAVDAKTLAELAQQMRANLSGVWRQPAVQKDNKTRRKQKDIQAEVLRGYEVAEAVIEGGLAKHPDDWGLTLAMAALQHDRVNYRRLLATDASFSQSLEDAIALFHKAAELYAATVAELEQEEETTRVFELWYYASLGASDLGQLTPESVPDLSQPPRIREAILALPGEAADRHLAMFANTLFTRMSAVKPEAKFRYVRTGLDIVGDHKRAAEARKVYDYYQDLVTEIKLDTVIDGSDVVGHTEPFGVFVNLRHTREIERESGGFGRYLQNQNNGNVYYYNYGRPLQNYRDRFEEVVHQSLSEQFEVLSVTFQAEDVNSKATEEYGWRVTPYAYLMLKARGPEVDSLPSVRLDLDFLDTSGYAVIPVESSPLPIDALPESGAARPMSDLRLTQTLDERQANEGKLILEVQATAQGLVPDLDQLVELDAAEFDVVEVEDQGLSVSRFDPDSDATVVLSERTWLVSMNAKPDLPAKPSEFRFGEPKTEAAETVYQRYNDADLLSVSQVISLDEEYGETSLSSLWVVGVVAILALAALAVMLVWTRRKPTVEVAGYAMPSDLTPFTVLGLLRQIERNNGFNSSGKQELSSSINRIEAYFFGAAGEEPDLEEIAASWIRKAK